MSLKNKISRLMIVDIFISYSNSQPSTRSQGISQFYPHTSSSSANGMNHTCLCLPSRSWYSFTDSRFHGKKLRQTLHVRKIDVQNSGAPFPKIWVSNCLHSGGFTTTSNFRNKTSYGQMRKRFLNHKMFLTCRQNCQKMRRNLVHKRLRLRGAF